MHIVVLGDRDPRYITHRKLDAALALFPDSAHASWTATDDPAARRLDDACGVWLVPGSPYRDDAAAYAAIRHCLTTGTPFREPAQASSTRVSNWLAPGLACRPPATRRATRTGTRWWSNRSAVLSMESDVLLCRFRRHA